MKKLNYTCEDLVKVVQSEDLKSFLEKTYEIPYFFYNLMEIDYPTKTKLLTVFSQYENIDRIEFSSDNELENDYVIYFKNGNKKTILTTEFKSCQLIFGRQLMENKDLLLVDTIKLLPVELNNFFRTTIKRKIEVILPDAGCELSDKFQYENISYITNFIPEKIINLEDASYTRRVKENNQIRFKLTDGKDYSAFDKAFYETKKIRILDKDIYSTENYMLLRTYNNNLIILSKNNEEA